MPFGCCCRNITVVEKISFAGRDPIVIVVTGEWSLAAAKDTLPGLYSEAVVSLNSEIFQTTHAKWSTMDFVSDIIRAWTGTKSRKLSVRQKI